MILESKLLLALGAFLLLKSGNAGASSGSGVADTNTPASGTLIGGVKITSPGKTAPVTVGGSKQVTNTAIPSSTGGGVGGSGSGSDVGTGGGVTGGVAGGNSSGTSSGGPSISAGGIAAVIGGILSMANPVAAGIMSVLGLQTMRQHRQQNRLAQMLKHRLQSQNTRRLTQQHKPKRTRARSVAHHSARSVTMVSRAPLMLVLPGLQAIPQAVSLARSALAIPAVPHQAQTAQVSAVTVSAVSGTMAVALARMVPVSAAAV